MRKAISNKQMFDLWSRSATLFSAVCFMSIWFSAIYSSDYHSPQHVSAFAKRGFCPLIVKQISNYTESSNKAATNEGDRLEILIEYRELFPPTKMKWLWRSLASARARVSRECFITSREEFNSCYPIPTNLQVSLDLLRKKVSPCLQTRSDERIFNRINFTMFLPENVYENEKYLSALYSRLSSVIYIFCCFIRFPTHTSIASKIFRLFFC